MGVRPSLLGNVTTSPGAGNFTVYVSTVAPPPHVSSICKVPGANGPLTATVFSALFKTWALCPYNDELSNEKRL